MGIMKPKILPRLPLQKQKVQTIQLAKNGKVINAFSKRVNQKTLVDKYSQPELEKANLNSSKEDNAATAD